MKLIRCKSGILILVVIILSVGVPRTSTLDISSTTRNDYDFIADSGVVTDVPYVWQELNGFCSWATFSMTLQNLGFQMDLADVLALSGVGLSAGCIRYEDIWIFSPGSMYKQQSSLTTVAELLGVEVEFYFDRDSTDFGPVFSLIMDLQNVSWTEIDGWDDAFQTLKDSIDNGYPVELYVNIQNLPASDYDFYRDLGITDTDPTHSVLAIGYNETSGTVQIMDPAIGLFDNPASFPDDGRWFYEINLSSLNQAWLGIYGITIVKPGSGITEDFTDILGNYILDRLRGDRTSYAPDSEEVFFWNFGSNAFRALAADLTAIGLSSFMDEFDEYDLHTKSIILQNLGFEIETTLTLQCESYRAAIEALPGVLPDLDLQDFVTEARAALNHFEVFSDNDTVNTPFYPAGEKMMTKTLEKIAYQYEYVENGDLPSAVSAYEEDLAEIRTHLTAIADAWDAAADALERTLQGVGTFPTILLSISVGGIVVLALVIIRRR